jgi:hypothetical protein
MKVFFFLAFVAIASAQEKTPQLAPPKIFDPANPLGVLTSSRMGLVPRKQKELAGIVLQSAEPRICSVPLLEAHVDASDPGIESKLESSSVAIPQAKLPAPPCPKP